MSEVDKFKRRVIRAVARMLRKDQTPGEEMWKALQNEAGCDCKLLWQRMRALTLKKMKRLILAEDRLDNIAAVAKMTLTDWLLFDLVLVHEDIDVIGQDLKTEPKMLNDLFNVVKRFQIEGKQGDALATAWTAATFYYNSFGRQCSPMLLQRRWYQLKKLTRASFYKLWLEYRGNARFLESARAFQPTKLMNDIAQRYPYIITTPFLEWDKLIKDKLIILPEEFEAKIKKKNAKPKPETNEPDLVLLEPRIETIDLGVDSDHEKDPAEEDSRDSTSTNNLLNPVSLAAAIKEEPKDDFEMDFEDHFDGETIEDTQTADNLILEDDKDDNAVNNNDEIGTAVKALGTKLEVSDDVQEINTMPMICSVAGNFNEDSVTTEFTNEAREIRDEVMDEVNDIPVSAANVRKETSGDNFESSSVGISEDEKVDSIPIKKSSVMQPIVIDEADDSDADTPCQNQVMTEINNILESAIQDKPQIHVALDDALTKEKKGTDLDKCVAKVIEDISEVSDTAIELDSTTDDVKDMTMEVEDVDESHDKEINDVTDVKVEESSLGEIPENIPNVKDTLRVPKVDDLINDPSIIDIPPDLTFEDDGIELVDDGIAFEEENEHKVKSESEDMIDSETNEENQKFDLKLLMHPCVYTIKLENMTVFKNKSIDHVNDKILLETAIVESKIHVKPTADVKTEQDNESAKPENVSDGDSSDSEEGIPENKKVKASSYMLQKPKSRSYNPIQLCKNPDFNTRLKRLTFGFLSSNRNRLLLKCLKPMTVDLSKAFESKLIDGTIYLKSDDGPKIKCEKPDEPIVEPNVTAVVPSAMPVQSLIDIGSVDLRDLLPPPPPPPPPRPHEPLPERQKTINLPDIQDIRRINQHLLTAEVTPMRIQSNDKFVPPVQLVVTPKPTAIDALGKNRVNGNAVTSNPVANSETPSKSKDASGTEAGHGAPSEKKKYARPTCNLNWNSIKRIPVKTTGPDEFLLTLDALNKMLHAFNDEPTAKNARQSKKLLIKQRMELQKRVDMFEKKIEDEPLEPVAEKPEGKKTKSVTSENKKEEQPKEEVMTPKINIVTDKPYGAYCCWARNKLEIDGRKAIRAHRCPRICRCCCREELAKKLYRKGNPKVEKGSATIVISDDEETTKYKKVCESIENVVSQSRTEVEATTSASTSASTSTSTSTSTETDSTTVQIPKETTKTTDRIVTESLTTAVQTNRKTRTEVSIQCDMTVDSSSEGRKPDFVVAPKPTMKILEHKTNKTRNKVITMDYEIDGLPLQSSREKRKPVRVRKDLLMSTNYKSILPRVTRQRHITIDASQRNLQIHSEPVHFNSRGNEKILYLNNNQKSKDLTSPIFLGENKILLTDVKFPNKDPLDLMLPASKPTVMVLPTVPQVAAAAIPQNLATVPVLKNIAPASPPQNLTLAPTLVMPPGVQILLLPDGQLSYAIDSTATLSDDELASLPVILEAIRKQIDAATATTAVPSTTIEVVNQTDENQASVDIVPPVSEPTEATQVVHSGKTSTCEEASCNKELDELEKCQPEAESLPEQNTIESGDNSGNEYGIKPTEQSNEKQQDLQVENQIDSNLINEGNVINTDCEDNKSSTEGTSAASTNDETVHYINQTDKEHSQTEPTDTQNTPSDTTVDVPIESSADSVPDNKTEKTDETTNSTANSRKTLLSDLMEMSGISEEDIQTNVPTINDNTTVQPDLVPATPVIDISMLPGVTREPSTATTRVISGSLNVPELTPVTSFSQLRYACQNNGRFFKLDLQLGTLTKIAVCIKKNKIKPSLKPYEQKSVIDLTDDQDDLVKPVREDQSLDETLPKSKIRTNKDHVSLEEEVIPSTIIKTNRSLLKSNNQPDSVKPLKLFRSIRILKTNNKDLSIPVKVTSDTVGGLPEGTIRVKQKRKQELYDTTVSAEVPKNVKLQREIETEDCSLDSTELDQYIWKDSEDDLVSSDSDTSDDEPLANKAKRMRLNESNSLGGETNKEAPRPEMCMVVEDTNSMNKKASEMNDGSKSLMCNEKILDDVNRSLEDKGSTNEADTIEEADIIEETDIPEDSDMVEDFDIAGVEEVPIEEEILEPALQVERLEEDEDCILGF